mgnify:CR=1
MKTPLVSVILVNFNGLKWLETCLSSLTNQSYKNIEVVFVDNASSDESISFVKNNYKKVKIVALKENVGFAGGNNAGLPFCHGTYLCLLNTDTTIEKGYIEKMIQPFKTDNSLAIAQSKIVLMDKPSIIDTCGSYWTGSTFLYHMGNGKNANKGMYNKNQFVFSVKAASVMIRKSVVDEIGLFDSRFWNYYEETDFCHRAMISGYSCMYYPSAICYHAGGGTTLSEFNYDYIQFHNFKNKLASFLKNFDRLTLVFVLPKFLFLNFVISALWLLTGKWRFSVALYKAIWWNISNLKDTFKLRMTNNRNRVKRDSEYLPAVTRNPQLNYYVALFTGNFKNYIDYE